MDNLRLSMNPDLSDTKVLRYRSNAVALSRAGEQCRKILTTMQANRTCLAQQPKSSAISAAVAAPAIPQVPPPAQRQPSQPDVPPAARVPAPLTSGPVASPAAQSEPPITLQSVVKTWPPANQLSSTALRPASTFASPEASVTLLPRDLESMRLQARAMLAAYTASPSQSAATIPDIRDPAILITAAVKQALTASRPTKPG
jgi:hypothetical protein